MGGNLFTPFKTRKNAIPSQGASSFEQAFVRSSVKCST